MANPSTSPLILAHLLKEHSVRNVIVSPGTRNALLIRAINRIPELKTYNVVDERTAGFVALGMAIKKEEPVALVCTSGTALLNYAPAVAEAYYRQIPLIVISADRPAKWIDQDEGQTIRQVGALTNIVKAGFDLPSDVNIDGFEWIVNRTVNQALLTAVSEAPGPVHINVPLDTPLDILAEKPLSPMALRVIRKTVVRDVLDLSKVKEIFDPDKFKTIGIVVGTNLPDAKLNKALQRISQYANVMIFAEAQSNVKGLTGYVDKTDITLSALPSVNKDRLVPDLLISIGGTVVSESFKSWLRNTSKKYEHWYVGFSPSNTVVDCYTHLSRIVECEAAPLLNGISAILSRAGEVASEYKDEWRKIAEDVNIATRTFFKDCIWCDMSAINAFFENISQKIDVHISNGMAIRYAQISNYKKANRIDCNRGCNGIDGCSSTSVGAALAGKTPVFLLTGDMSFRYDSGALDVSGIPPTMAIFLINNNGGDIFRVIKNTRDTEICESHLAKIKNVDYSKIAEAYGFKYVHVADSEQLKKAIEVATHDLSAPKIIEIDTRSAENSLIYRQYYQSIKNIINGE